ncbi:hypothetical protein GQ457_04G016540 [Hibiscus cannabinus]
MGNLFCCVQVDQSTVVIKERIVRFKDVLEPGCHCLPWFLGIRLAGHLSLRLQQSDIRCETKTNVCLLLFYVVLFQFIKFSFVCNLRLLELILKIQFHAPTFSLCNHDKASDVFYKLTNTNTQIHAYVFDVIRASVPKLNMFDVYKQKIKIAKKLISKCSDLCCLWSMSAYEYEVVQTCIVDIEPDVHVNEINAGNLFQTCYLLEHINKM